MTKRKNLSNCKKIGNNIKKPAKLVLIKLHRLFNSLTKGNKICC
ncbi:MAG: hypothetical protein ACI32Y_05915 [Clostridium sp.]